MLMTVHILIRVSYTATCAFLYRIEKLNAAEVRRLVQFRMLINRCTFKLYKNVHLNVK